MLLPSRPPLAISMGCIGLNGYGQADVEVAVAMASGLTSQANAVHYGYDVLRKVLVQAL